MRIELENVSFIYNEKSSFERRALDNASLTIEQGEFIGVIGRTGSGKSTLIQHLNALVKPTSGRVLIDGADINADKSLFKSVRRRVGLVFQYPEHQLFEMTVAKDVAFGPRNLGLAKEEIDKRVSEALELVGIPEALYEKSPFDLSGGQKRRVAIAGVLAMRPETLILDEPTAGLDPKGRDDILGNICEMREKLGITVILVSHSMEDIGKYCERIIVMNDGKIVRCGTRSEIFGMSSELEALGLAAPQITCALSALRERGFDISDEIFTVKDAAEAIYKAVKRG